VAQTKLTVSTDIPPLHDALELVRLSGLVYVFREKKAKDCSSFPEIFDEFMKKEEGWASSHDENKYTFECHMYERDELDTQVLVVSRTGKNKSRVKSEGTNVASEAGTSIGTVDPEQDYIAVVYAGTDDFRNALTDTNLSTKYFGPSESDDNDYYSNYYSDDDKKPNPKPKRNYNFPPKSQNIRVHAGFNNAVFKHGLFDRIYDTILNFKTNHNPSARILTTGHSLGAADAILTATALKLQHPFQNKNGTSNEIIHSINFGCPKTGNKHWKKMVNDMDGLGIWRVVNGLDLVPRLPGVRFHHVGHTLQLDKRVAKGYWLHEGDRSLGYAGIPFGWNTLPYALAPVAAYGHLMSHYSQYFDEKSTKDPARYYISSFETITAGTDDGNGKDGIYYNDDDDVDDEDDAYLTPPDDDLRTTVFKHKHHQEYAEDYAEHYMHYFNEELRGINFGSDHHYHHHFLQPMSATMDENFTPDDYDYGDDMKASI